MQRRPAVTTISTLAQKRRRRAQRKLIACAIGLLLFFVGTIIVSRASFWNISEIHIQGNSVIAAQDIEAVIKKALGGYYAGMYPRTNVVIYPAEDIRGAISSSFSRIDLVQIRSNGMRALDVVVRERKSDALWCIYNKEGNLFTDECYFMDQAGYVFDKAPQFSDNVYIKYYGLLGTSTLGQVYLKDVYSPLTKFVSFINSSGPLRVEKVLAKDDGDIDLVVKGGGRILVGRDQDFSKVFNNLNAILNEKMASSSVRSISSRLDYLDLRFGNKVYFKLR